MKQKITSVTELMNREFGQDAEYQEMLAEERVKARAARAIYEARIEAGLTQKQLADLIGTQQSAIARLEDADYKGHSLAVLDRIARALNRRVEIRFIPVEERRTVGEQESLREVEAEFEGVDCGDEVDAVAGLVYFVSGNHNPDIFEGVRDLTE